MAIVDAFHWTLKDINDTDIESLIEFVFKYPKWKERTDKKAQQKTAYADEVNWW